MRRRLPLPLLGALLALYLLGPIVVLLVRLAGGAGSTHGAPGLGHAVWISALTATISTVIIGALGIPLANLLARRRGPAWTALGLAVQLPLALPPLMSGILLIEVVGPYTTIGRLLGGRLTDTTAAIVLAQVFVASPFLIVAARSAFETVDPDLLDVAATLGHDGWSRFWRVSLPLAAPGVRAGLLLAWLRAFGEFGATVILAYHPYSLPVFTFVQFSSTGLATALPATATALGTATLVLVLSHLRPPRRRAGPSPGRRVATPGTPGTPGTLGTPGTPGAPGASGTGVRNRAAGLLAFELRARVGTFELELAHRCRAPRLAILGASGAGKSLTLRCLAGLRAGQTGTVTLGSQTLSRLPPQVRRVGWVPQGGALLPHLTVWRQLTFPAGADPRDAAGWLERLGLTALAGRLPSELSGGQRQRVALARALVAGADLLLLDEPLASLDAPARRELGRELRRLQRETGIATVLVTHDADEAAALSDEVLVIDAGQVLQAGPTREVFGRPATEQVARLLGIANLRVGRAGGGGRIITAGTEVRADGADLAPGTPVCWCVRAERLRLTDGSDHEPSYEARVLDALEVGAGQELELLVEDELELTVRTFGGDRLAPGEACRVAIPPSEVTIWPTGSAGVKPGMEPAPLG